MQYYNLDINLTDEELFLLLRSISEKINSINILGSSVESQEVHEHMIYTSLLSSIERLAKPL